MTYIYLWGGVLTLLCAGLVLWTVEKTFRRRAVLEERQRDFTNAIAHEMKTPLAVILLSGKLNDALSGRLFYADFGSHGANSHFKNGCFCELFS